MIFMQIETYHGHFQVINNTKEGTLICPEHHAQYRSAAEAAKAYDVEESDVETVFGWAARYSAPGYMDCTEWSYPCDSEAKAVAEVKEMYGDDEEENGAP